jgi:hypothetical protein
MALELGQTLAGGLNQIAMKNIAARRRLPSTRDPTGNPLGQAIHRIFGIGVDHDVLIVVSTLVQDNGGPMDSSHFCSLVCLGFIGRKPNRNR